MVGRYLATSRKAGLHSHVTSPLPLLSPSFYCWAQHHISGLCPGLSCPGCAHSQPLVRQRPPHFQGSMNTEALALCNHWSPRTETSLLATLAWSKIKNIAQNELQWRKLTTPAKPARKSNIYIQGYRNNCLLITTIHFSLLTTASRNSMHLFKSGLESQNCLKRSLPIGCLSQSWL